MEKIKKAFTLAEVLITLSIIGVIAAITIPNLMQNWRRHERITQIKTAYSLIQNTIRMAVAEHGDVSGWSWENGGDFAEKYIVPYVKTQKICGMSSTVNRTFSKRVGGCFKKTTATFPNGAWFTLKGDVEEWGGFDSRYFYNMKLQNGMDLGVWGPVVSNQDGLYNAIYFYYDVFLGVNICNF